MTGAFVRLMQDVKPGVRPEIQALRAIAVMMVLLYHFWPAALPGGYAGVDVFFVISGFLITAHLLREVESTGRVNLPRFWARRARRLLPAALLVAAVSSVGVLLFVPVTFWQDWFMQAAAAVVYVLNWLLARNSVDYLASENNASPVQHYWSLSVEEQFYIVWPILIVLALALAARWLGRRRAVVVLLSGITLVSFAASVYLTMTNPASAYFVTTTRAWEFGVGGLLVFVGASASGRFRAVLGWVGVAGIGATAVLYTAATPFPGYTALLPVLSTAAVIWAGTTSQAWSVAQVARFRPVQYTGDVSYSLYLWHWPLIVIAPFAMGADLNGLTSALFLALSFVLAAVTKRFVEDPARTAPALAAARPRRTLIATAVAMALVVVVPGAGLVSAVAQERDGAATVAEMVANPPECFGAAAMVDEECGTAPLGTALFPNLAALKGDNTVAYDCYTNNPQNGKLMTCTYGEQESGGLRVAVTGDSHGAMLVTGLVPHLEDLGWSVDTFVSRGCTWAAADYEPECSEYRENLSEALLGGGYDVVLTTAIRNVNLTAEETEEFAASRASAWGPLLDAGVPVVAVSDNPRVPDSMVDCVIGAPVAAAVQDACVMPASQRESPIDSGPIAVDIEPRATLVDTMDFFCAVNGCPMVIGNVPVYRDQHHASATYLSTVMPYLVPEIEAAARQ